MPVSDAAGLVADTPARGWVIVGTELGRALCLAAAALATGAVIDAIGAGSDPVPALLAAAGCVLGAGLAAAGSAWLPARQQAVDEPRMRGRLAVDVHTRALDDSEPRGETVDRLTDTVERVANYRAAFLGPFLAMFVVPAAVLAVIAIALDGWIALLLTACIAAAPPVLGYFMARFRSSNRAYRAASARLAAEYLESIRALGTIAMLTATAQRRERLAELVESERIEVMRLLRRNQVVILVTDTVFALAVTCASGLIAIVAVWNGTLTGGEAIALMLISRVLLEPVDRLGREFYVGMSGRASSERIRTALRDAAASLPPEHPGPEPTGAESDGSVSAGAGPDAPATVSVRDVSLRRGNAEVAAGLSLRLAPGTVTALIGPSGAGKTSLALAVAGLIPVHGGTVMVDGEAADQPALLRAVSYVPQHTTLFTGSLAENLRLGAPDATDDELERALERVGLAKEIAVIGRGLDLPIGEDAGTLSGGQAQRVSIARALLARSRALVLDEPTAHLDRVSAAAVLDAIAEAARTTTVLMVTHRHEETAIADQVVALDSGALARGTLAGGALVPPREAGQR